MIEPPNWNFLAMADNHGTITPRQEMALVAFATRLGRERFGEYRQRVEVFGPIPRLSRGEAYRLIAAIVADLEQENNDRVGISS